MAWGISPWGTSSWGGVPLLSSVVNESIKSNIKPLPPQAISVQVSSTGGGAGAVTLDSAHPITEDVYKDSIAIVFDNLFYARRIASYVDRVLTFTHPFVNPIPNGTTFFILDTKRWYPDEYIASIYPSDATKRLDSTTLQFLYGFGRAGWDGFDALRCSGSPQAVHEGRCVEQGDGEGVYLDSSAAPSVPLSYWTTDDSFRGMLFAPYQGTGAGQVRRIVRYDGVTQRAYFDRELSETTDTTTKYEVRLDAHVSMQHIDPTGMSTDPDTYVFSHTAGSTLLHLGTAIEKNALTVQALSYTRGHPVFLHALLYLASVTWDAGRAQVHTGFRVHATGLPLSLHTELMHTGGGGAGDLVLRIWKNNGSYDDITLEVGSPPSMLVSRLLAISAVYSPSSDVLSLRVDEGLTSLPDTLFPVASLDLPNYSSGGLYEGEFLPQQKGGSWGYVSAGKNGAAATVQVLRFHMLCDGGWLVRDGRPVGLRSAQIAGIAADRPLHGRTPLQWQGLFRPLTTATAGVSNTAAASVATDAHTKQTVITKDEETSTAVMLVRFHPCLSHSPPQGFQFDVRMAVRSDEHTPYDNAGVAWGVVAGSSGSSLDFRLVCLRDVNRKMVGLLLSGHTTNGRYLQDYVVVDDVDWEQMTEYRLIHDPQAQVLYLFINDMIRPRLLLRGPALLSVSPVWSDSLQSAGAYVGILEQENTDPTVTLEYARLVGTPIGFFSSYTHTDLSAIYPPAYSSAHSLTEDTPSSVSFLRTRGADLIVDTNKLVLSSTGGRTYYTTDLAHPSVPLDNILTPSCAFCLDFGVRIAEVPTHDLLSLANGEGYWTGVGVWVDDGLSVLLVGLAVGGDRGDFLFVAAPTSYDTSVQYTVDQWLDLVLRYPEKYAAYRTPIDLYAHNDIRVVRSSVPTTYQGGAVLVYVNDIREPVLSIPTQGAEGIQTQGVGAQMKWGNLASDRTVTSEWSSVHLSASSGVTARVPIAWSQTERTRLTRPPSELLFATAVLVCEET